ncbi:MAG TPA: sugar phosphate nucleotidyltransferase [Actinomycetales bacterium]|nr:sugar phosphate nucleotidyltransferase [Actinomycetales bacterium]
MSDGLGRTSSPAARLDLAGVVLAAGLGTRLRPLTDLRPKALCPVNGVPLVDLALERVGEQVLGRPGPTCGLATVDHLAVNAHHHARQVERHLAGRAHLSVEQPVPLGTAGALGRLRPWLDGRAVLLTNADAYLPGGLDDLVAGWDGERCRLLVTPLADGVRGDFERAAGPVRYVGACLLPWRFVRDLAEAPSGLYEVMWRQEDEAGRLDLALTEATAIDCGTPADYLAANLHASGGSSVVGEGATVEGTLDRCVVWDGAFVGPDEQLSRVVRAGSRQRPVTVDCR